MPAATDIAWLDVVESEALTISMRLRRRAAAAILAELARR